MNNQEDGNQPRIADYGDYLAELVAQLTKQEKQYLNAYEEAIKRTHKAEVMLDKFNRLQNSLKK
jgi:hypothetical protein